MTVVPIVEGDSEVVAFPILLRRLTAWLRPEVWVEIPYPIRVKRDRFLQKPEELRRCLLLARNKAGNDGAVLVLLDADDDCPADLARTIRTRVQDTIGSFPAAVVLANREYEAWFLAAASSLHGVRGFSFIGPDPIDPELPRDAKGWISGRMAGKPYREVADQPALTAAMDLGQARDRSRSFRKLCSDWVRLLDGVPGPSPAKV